MRFRGQRTLPFAAMASVAVLLVSLLAAGVAGAVIEPMSVSAVRPEDPSVSGSRLVWADKRGAGYSIYAFDALTRTTRRLTPDAADHIQPSVSGDVVVWADYRNGDADIWAHDLGDGSQRPVVVASGDQLAPAISGKWLVYEDRSGSYNPSVKALDLGTGAVSTLASYGKRPRVVGDLAVWEDLSTSRVDANVRARDLATGVTYDVATASRQELLPATDGRYVAWAEGNGTDLDVRYFDTQTGRYGVAGAGAGEQTFPAVGDGVVYWLENAGGKRISLVTFDVAAGKRARYNDYGTEDIGAVSVSGKNVAWLAKSSTAWQVRVALDGGTVAAGSLGRLAPSPLATGGLARLTADPDAPEVVATSVERGETNVSDAAFTVRFSEPMDPGSVNGRTVRLLDARRRAVRGRVRYSALTRAATFTPRIPLAGGTYTLSVDAAVADASGNTLAEPQLVTFSTIRVLADTVGPTAPGAPVARVYQGNQVALSWNASTDDVGVTQYQVYRSNTAAPITGFPAGATLVTSSASTGATFAATPAEIAASYTYYYVIVARDAAGNTSASSLNAAPDPHGTFTSGRSTNLCMRCHAVHGNKPKLALGAKSAEACYECHGKTPAATAYGTSSSIDVQADFGDDSVIASGGPTVVGRGSVHRNAYMVGIQRECDGCHTPHKKPYDAANPTLSYNKLLRTQLSTNPAGYRYNTDAAAIGNQFCADCHGASATNIGIVGGATAYTNSGGDHLGVYASSAHATASVPVNAGDTNPSIQCEACHGNHKTAVAKLIDYRASNTSTADFDQSGLCFACHSVSGKEAGKPNTWNGRDVKSEFAKASHHPYTVPTPGPPPPPQPAQDATWTQTTDTEFTANELANVVAVTGGTGTSGALQLAAVTGGYEVSGVATSTVIAPRLGTTTAWRELRFTGVEPAGTQLLVDVLGTNDAVLLSGVRLADVTNGAPLVADPLLHPVLKLRARFAATPGTAPAVTDDFTDNSFDTTLWTDRFIGSTDPDAPASTQVANLTIANTSLTDATTGFTTASAQWARNNTFGGGANGTTGYARTNVGTHNTRQYVTENLGNLSAYDTFDFSYWYRNNGGTWSGDSLTVEYTTNGGTNWTTLRTFSAADATWRQTTEAGLPVGTDCRIRFGSLINDNTNWNAVDEIVVTGQSAAGASWPKETGGQLQLRAEGDNFTLQNDEGEFTYIGPAQAPWVDTDDWDMTVNVAAINNLSGQADTPAGLMVRTGTTEANALIIDAAMASVFVTPNNGVNFTYRTSTINNAVTVSAAGPTAPEWLKVSRRGNVFSAWYSANGTTWTQVGANQTVTMSTVVLPGLALSSGLDGTYSEATFDDFSISGLIPPPTVTPRLDDWTVGYRFTPPPPQPNSWAQTTDTEFGTDTLTNAAAVAGGSGTSGAAQLAAVTGGYQTSGDVLSTVIAPEDLASWDTLEFNGAQPAGTTLRVDVLDGATNAVLVSDLALGASPFTLNIDETLHPTLKLRARFTAAAGTAPFVADDFSDNSYNDGLWDDAFIGSTDPDAPVSNLFYNATFANTSVTDGTTGFTTNDSTRWARATTVTGANGSTGYARTNAGTHTTRQYLTKNLGDLVAAGYDTLDVSFWYRNNGGTWSGDSMTVEYTSNGGASWTTLNTFTTADTTWGQTTHAGLAVGTDCRLRFGSLINDGTNYNMVDEVQFTGQIALRANWPKETAGQLQLRAEGDNFTLQNDEGEFTYIDPTQAPWVDTDDWDMTVSVAAIDNLSGQADTPAGIMVRTGTTETNALIIDAAMASVFVTPNNGVNFTYRTSTIVNAVTVSAAGPTAPEWLKLSRRGNVFSAWYSGDGTTWTQVGANQTVTMSTVVLPGLALSSGLDGTYSEATFDSFRVQSLVIPPPPATPRLDDWTVNYSYYGPAVVSSGTLTCVNCHNAHGVQKGTAGTVWQASRASDPKNTRNLATNTTDFCLGCHTSGASRPIAGISASSLVPYTPGFRTFAIADSPFFPGWDKSASAYSFKTSAHYTTTGTKAYCENCHDPHGSDNPRLTAWTRPASFATGNAGSRANTGTAGYEQNLCYQCHGNGTVGKQATGAPNIATPASATYKHPMGTDNVHSDTEGPGNLGVGKRHSECADCHDPHGARANTFGPDTQVSVANTSAANGALRGAVGVKPTSWPAIGLAPTGYEPERLDGESDDYEAYLCLKCHSSYVTLPTTGGSGGYGATNLALEFNPNNASYHRVLGADAFGMRTSFGSITPKAGGTAINVTSWPVNAAAQTFRPAYNSNTMLRCTSCHMYNSADAAGPHGSSVKFMIDPAYPTAYADSWLGETGSPGITPTTSICAKCHVLDNGSGFGNNTHDKHARGVGSDRQGAGCRTCHVSIPHGWKRPRLIGYRDDPAPYATPSAWGITGIALQATYTSQGWQESDCGGAGNSCGKHNNTISPAWP